MEFESCKITPGVLLIFKSCKEEGTRVCIMDEFLLVKLE